MDQVGDVFAMAGARPWPRESGMDCVAPAERLRDAFATLRKRLRDRQQEPDYIYTARARVSLDSDLVSEGSGSISGFRIAGENCSLDLGFNQCVLSRWRVRPDGMGEIVTTQDVRHLSYIETDDLGRITIGRKKAASAADKWIAKVLKKLQGMEGDVVVEVA